jgi:cytochrome-b5 reductase
VSTLGTTIAYSRDTWTAFKLNKVEPHNHNSNVYHFDFPEEAREKASGIQVAGAILVKTPEGDKEVKDDKGKPVIRCVTSSQSH